MAVQDPDLTRAWLAPRQDRASRLFAPAGRLGELACHPGWPGCDAVLEALRSDIEFVQREVFYDASCSVCLSRLWDGHSVDSLALAQDIDSREPLLRRQLAESQCLPLYGYARLAQSIC
jgi:hypothetical protein